MAPLQIMAANRPPAPDEDDQTTEEPSAAAQPTKAQARRAQVRKAQIQHRQRKANYVKELEMDITRLRDLISETQRGSSILRRENEYIRSQASVHYIITPVLVPAEAPPAPPDLSRILGEVTMALEFDEVLDAPTYRITSSPDMMSVDSQDDLLAAEQAADPGMLPFLGLSPEQTQQVINFILAYVFLVLLPSFPIFCNLRPYEMAHTGNLPGWSISAGTTLTTPTSSPAQSQRV